MIENNNKNIINKVAKKSFKANKSRNKFAIASIALTTLLFTILPVLLASPMLLVTAIALPNICFRKVSKESIVEALRENE